MKTTLLAAAILMVGFAMPASSTPLTVSGPVQTEAVDSGLMQSVGYYGQHDWRRRHFRQHRIYGDGQFFFNGNENRHYGYWNDNRWNEYRRGCRFDPFFGGLSCRF